MAKNTAREFATMDDDDRRKFAEEPEGKPTSLDFGDPRDADHMGRDYQTPRDEIADPEHRDGGAALLDDREHFEHVREEAKEAARALERKRAAGEDAESAND